VTALVFLALALAGGVLALRPLARPGAWPAEPADERDEVARAVSSLRDLEFARAAGTIAPEDHARLRAALERGAFVEPIPGAPATAPIRTFVVAALLCGAAAVLVVLALPREVGDRAPGATITGTVPAAGPSLVELEARAKAEPRDIPSQLALADAYLRTGRAGDAAGVYRAVLTLDRDNVPALNGLAVILELAGERDGAQIAVDRVLALRPRDADALFMQGLIRYKKEDWRGAVDAWTVFLEVGEFHPAADMVRPLYGEARRRLGGG